MKKQMLLAASALACAISFGAELNVAEGETLTLREDMSVTGGSVAGTLVLEGGMTLVLSDNVFASTAVVEMRGATIVGFSGTTEPTFSNVFDVAADTQNEIRNVDDSWSHEGCNVHFNGKVVGSGSLSLVSTGRGFIIGADFSEFEGALNLAMDGNYFAGRIGSADMSKATLSVVSGLVNFSLTDIYIGHLNICEGAAFNDDRGWNDSNRIHIMGDSVLAGDLTGNEIDLYIKDGASVEIDCAVPRVYVESGCISGNGTIGRLQTDGHDIAVENEVGSVLTVNGSWGTQGRMVITGGAERPSGNDIVRFADASPFNVELSGELASKGWKLVFSDGTYSIWRPGFAIILR